MPVYYDEKRKSWYVKHSTTVTGKRKQIMKRGFPTQKSAKAWEAEQIVSSPVHTSATFMDLFEENLKFLNSSATSANMKRSWIEKHFPYCNEPIEKISKPMLIEWRNSLETSRLAARTINRGLGYIRSVFTYANSIYNVPNNGSVIRSYKLTKEDKKEMDIWTPQEFQQFIDCVDEGYYKAFFTFLYWTGTRRGEALGLCKDDFSGNKVHIHRQIKHHCNGFTELKTGTSERTISIDKKTCEYLQPFIKEACPFVFGGIRCLAITSIQRYFTEAIEKSGVKKVRLHDLRHSHASVLISAGVPIIAVSKRLGHSSINITLSTYAHLLQKTEDEMVSAIDELRAAETKNSGEG